MLIWTLYLLSFLTLSIDCIVVTTPSSSTYSASWREDTALGAVILSPKCTNTNPVVWTLAGTDATKFAISQLNADSTSASVTLATAMDYETPPIILLFQIIVAETGVSTVTVSVTINVVDVFDVAPVFSPTSYLCQIAEESLGECDQVIGVTDVETSHTPPDVVTCSITGLNSNYFKTDNCHVQLNTKIDRDNTNSITDFPNLVLTATDKGLKTATASVSVTITDINDNTPVCVPSTYSMAKAENTVGTLTTLTCTDLDLLANSQLSCSTASTEFSVVFAGSACTVTFTAGIDYEVITTNPIYFTVLTKDGGTPSLTNTVSFSITITGLEDNVPMWGTWSPPYVSATGVLISVPENTAIGTSLFTVVATDADKGVGGTLTYSLSSVTGDNTDSLLNNFLIKPNGQVDVQLATLDYEKYTNIDFVVQVTDGTNTLSKTARIALTDVNEFSPVFTPTSGFYSKTMTENAAANTAVVTIVAKDPDKSNSAVTCSIDSGNTPTVFQIATTNAITLSQALVVDQTTSLPTSYLLILSCTDGAKVSTATVSITVSLTNDFNPVITQASTTITVPENQSPGQISTFTVTDSDAGAGGIVTCALSVSSAIFSTTSCNSLLLQSALDYETNTQHIIVIVATDNGSPSKSTSSTVTITVTDVNDNLPTCTENAFTISKAEAPAPATPVALYTIPCNDVDTSGATISITAGNTNSAFSISGKSLQWVGLLNYEATTSYTLTVTITESVTPFRTAAMTIFINVLPVNEFTPTFTTATYSVAENLVLGGNVGVPFVAADADTGGHGVVSYTLLSQLTIFSISNAGQVTLIASLDYESMSGTFSYLITVKATDGGGLTGTGTLTVSVTDVNDNMPVCSSSSFTATLVENATTATNVVIVTAPDGDGTSPNNLVKYTIVSGDTTTSYTIALNTGQISLKSPTNLNYDVQSSYTLLVEARDGNGAGIFSTTCTVFVTITDFNAGTPTFSPTTVTQTISENTAIGTQVNLATATDTDLKQKSTYTISPNVAFGVDQLGKVYLAKVVDYETNPITYTLTITATDNGTPQKSGSYTLTVSITDYNEFDPSCTAASLVGSVPENSIVDTKVGTLICTDSDATKSYLYYTGTSPFKMTGADLMVASFPGLDYETVTSISAVIEVRDNLVLARTTTVTYVVSISPVNEFAPVFTGITPTYSFSENMIQGYIVATITATDADKGSNHGIIKYSISGTNVANKFTIDINTGAISLANTIDYETEAKVYNILVTATDGGLKTGTVSITVSVQDYNDNTPVASPNPKSVTVLESAAVGSSLLDLATMITDADSTINGQTTTTIDETTNTNSYFQIVNKVVQVKTAPLSAVSNPVVNLQIIIKDGGTPQLSSILLLQVNILGANQYPPVVSVVNFVVTLAEDVAVGTKFYTCNASDADGNQPSGKLVWSIDSATDPTTTFVIQSDTGDLRIFKALDYETTKLYTFVTIVKDQGTPPRSASMSITVSVTDVNDNDPQFPATNQFSVGINENQPAITAVTTVVATDKDSGLNGQVQYFIVSQNFGSMFQLDANSGILATTQSLDREANENYSILIKAVDLGTPPRTVMQTWSITVLDLNDNTPTFGSITPLTVSVSEDKPKDTFITQLIATDKDKGANAIVSYTLVAADAISNASYFSIDSTGTIKIAAGLDREQIPTFTLAVVARDGGTPQLSSSVTITISLLDVNDNYPVIAGNPITVSVAENSPVDTLIHNLVATDADIGVNAVLAYAIVSGNTGNAFKIDGLTGVIKVMTAILDYESIKIYTLLVQVKDGGTPSLSSTGTVTVSLLDLNDNAPVFGSASYSFSTTENLPVGTLVGTPITATDLDSGINGQIAFSMGTNILSPGLGYFLLNSASGQLSLTSSIDREVIPKFIFTVLATDKGLTPHTSTATVTVDVIDVNDNAPVKVGDYSNVHVTENVPLGNIVVQIIASDADAGLNSNLVYGMNSTALDGTRANVLFQINSTSGIISTKSPIDRETDGTLSFNVLVQDQAGGSTSLSTTISLKIVIDDLNDNVPVFSKSFFSLEIAYNITNSYAAGQVTATDIDQGLNGMVSYTWQSSNTIFLLDQTAGIISKSSTAVLAPSVGYIYIVQATDGGTPSLSSQATVRMDTFDPSKYAVQITINMDNFDGMLSGLLKLLSTTLAVRYPTNRVGFMYKIASTSRRRLLGISTSAYYYAVANSDTDSSGGNSLTKSFVSSTELLALWRLDSTGNPTSTLLTSNFGNITVTKVQGYVAVPTTTYPWYQTDIGIAVITLSCLIFALLLAILIGCLVVKKKNTNKVSDSRRTLVKDEKKSKIVPIILPTFVMENSDSVVKKVNSSDNPVYNDNNPYNLAPPPKNRGISPADISF